MMSACELLYACPFFNDSMYKIAETDKERYCKGAYSWCGRYMTLNALERTGEKEIWRIPKG